MVSDWQNATLTLITVVSLALGFRLIWRALIQPDALARMEARLDRQRAQLEAHQAEIDELRAESAADREKMAVMQIEMAEWRAGMRLVFEQLRALNITPAWTPRESPPRYSRRPANKLAERIGRQFNHEELDNLAFDMDIGADEIGEGSDETRARRLVELAERRGLVTKLGARVNELRES